MKLFVAITAFLGIATTIKADCALMVDDGYFIEGVAGYQETLDPESDHNKRLTNNTWAPGMYYPHGELVKCEKGSRRCSDECAENGCPKFLGGHTCSLFRFCPATAESTGSSIWQMPDFEATDTCNFEGATLVGQTFTGSVQGCYDYVFEEDHELKDYYFAAKEGCEQGQKVAITIEDGNMREDQCYESGKLASRIANCDCTFEKKTTTISEPCRTAYSESCLEHSRDDTSCCETGTCYSRLQDYEDPLGEAAEEARLEECVDDTPGNCYNEDAGATGNDGEGSIDCCGRTCSVCGIKQTPTSVWKSCTAYDSATSTANCGFLSRYDSEPTVCDFTQCPEGAHWHPDGAAFKKYFNIIDDGTNVSSKAEASAAQMEKAGSTVVVAMGLGLVNMYL